MHLNECTMTFEHTYCKVFNLCIKNAHYLPIMPLATAKKCKFFARFCVIKKKKKCFTDGYSRFKTV